MRTNIIVVSAYTLVNLVECRSSVPFSQLLERLPMLEQVRCVARLAKNEGLPWIVGTG